MDGRAIFVGGYAHCLYYSCAHILLSNAMARVFFSARGCRRDVSPTRWGVLSFSGETRWWEVWGEKKPGEDFPPHVRGILRGNLQGEEIPNWRERWPNSKGPLWVCEKKPGPLRTFESPKLLSPKRDGKKYSPIHPGTPSPKCENKQRVKPYPIETREELKWNINLPPFLYRINIPIWIAPFGLFTSNSNCFVW